MRNQNLAIDKKKDNYTERRKSVRRSTEKLSVLLDMYEMGYLRGKLEDISKEGMFVSTMANVLRPNSTIEVLFNTDGELKRAEARIVRKTAKGIGLWFDRSDECNQWLKNRLLPAS